MKMRVFIRTDASLEIGIGHVMRCLTIAEGLRERGAQCEFICREHVGNLLDLIREQGFRAHSLPMVSSQPRTTPPLPCDSRPYSSWLGTDWQTDAQQTLSVLARHRQLDWLIVDHYALDSQWESLQRPHTKKIFVIDDLADRHHQCSLLLDQTLGRSADDYTSWVPPTCTVLCGAQYALLRPEFARLRPYSLKRRANNPRLMHLLISMGGIDKDNVTGTILRTLRSCSLPPECRITVVMGKNAPWIAEVQSGAKTLPWRTTVEVDVRDMATLMADADLAIGAAGATSWERCSLGVPTVMVPLAENQRLVAQGLAQKGAACVIPNPPDIDDSLPNIINELCASPSALTAVSAAATRVTDGMGLSALISHLER